MVKDFVINNVHVGLGSVFIVALGLKVLLIPAYHSTDFEVHRNWLAITHSLPLNQWYVDATSEWTLDYPPLFAYFEWLLSQVASLVDPQMLVVQNLNYASERCKSFQRGSVIAADLLYVLGAWYCLRVLRIPKGTHRYMVGLLLLLLNVGLIFVDHIHFQYNGFLFGMLLLSIGFLLRERFLASAFMFAVLLNFKHIFLYMAPAFAAYLLKFYCLESGKNFAVNTIKLLGVGLTPFVLSFGPFWRQLPQVLGRLFPFRRGLTHAYWAPNFWALYNTADKAAAVVLSVPRPTGGSTSSGLVQEFEHMVLPTITPKVTFVLTALFMLPVLAKLFFYTSKGESKLVFLRSVVLCACASFVFGWHVHEKAILMCLIPLCLTCLLDSGEAKYAFLLSLVGYFSLFPLLFHVDLLLIRYALYLAYVTFMYAQLLRMHNVTALLNRAEKMYVLGFLALPVYEHLVGPLLGLNQRLPFMPLLLTSLYCSVGVMYFFIRYYFHTLGVATIVRSLLEPKPAKIKSTQKAHKLAQSAAETTANGRLKPRRPKPLKTK